MINILKKEFPHYPQLDMMDCGATCLKMVAKYYGKSYSLPFLREQCHIDRQGVSLTGISDAAEKIGMRTMAINASFELLSEDVPLPCIAYWRQNHFIVIYKIKKGKVYVADPATGLVVYSREEFCRYWLSNRQHGESEGIVLLLEPSPEFYERELDEKERSKKTDIRFLFKYMKPYHRYIMQVFLSLFVGSMLSLTLPFLTQSLVDFGINNQDIGFVYAILIAQLMLFAGKTSVDFIRSWILLHISARVNLSVLSDFLIKLMKLPVAFFDSKNLGDILQRMADHSRIKVFLTSSSFDVVFSMFNLVVFGIVLLFYSGKIFLIFAIGSILYVTWILLFLKRRKQIDYRRFNQLSSVQNNSVQLITGMQEIKLNNCERQKRWEWEGIQTRLFKVEMSSLSLMQSQNAGGLFINELKNILISIVSAREVIDGQMTLGMMMAVSYILGQLNAPLLQMIHFIQEAQDVQTSLERMGEIHNKKDEDQDEDMAHAFTIPDGKDLIINNVSFRYGNPNADFVLKNVSMVIPRGKTTAIVGASGSGKTTLLKLLLKFYDPESGSIRLGDMPLKSISSKHWRGKCGAVMQDGFIFSDTIARNIAVVDEVIDKERLLFAAGVANIREFVEALPLNYNTKIGGEGVGISQGQRLRILIARAVYKNPEFLFFDEATSALDARNEREITEKLEHYFENKTALIIAHRLSTVRNAHQIVVLDKGEVRETGTHEELTAKRGLYYELVKNQLELGN